MTYSTRLVAEGWLAGERRLYEDADAWTPPAAREAAAEAARQAQELTLGEYADEWITHRDVKPRTREGYRALLANHIKPTLGDTPVGELSAPAVRAGLVRGAGDRADRQGARVSTAARRRCHRRHRWPVGREPVHDHFPDRIPVADHKPVEFPVLL